MLQVQQSVRGLTRKFILLLLLCTAQVSAAESYDVVINAGRVIDPDSGLDATRNVGINGGSIVAISQTPLTGKVTIDATGKIVAPGFIDLHSHAQTKLGQHYQVLDGVTTALELEAGAYPVAAVGNQIADQVLINYGASAGYFAMRIKVMEDKDQPYAFFGDRRLDNSGPGFKQVASERQIEMLRRHLALGLDQGGLGIGLLLDYMSDAVSDTELQMIFEVAAQRQVPVFVHIRRGIAGDPAGLEQVIKLAGETGAAVHVCHLNANAMGNIEHFLALIQQAREAGIDISTEAYPYNAGSTLISAEAFNRDWQKIFGITYADVQWADSGEYLTESTWHEYRKNQPQGTIIHHYGRESWTRQTITAPGVMVASDALPVFSELQKVHPRTVGTFARILGRYVREQELLDLPSALAKMSLLPARRMQTVAPVFAHKGRLQIGADADVVIFDLAKVTDHATYANPFQPSSGIETVLVNGQIVVRDGKVQTEVYPGRLLIGSGR